MSLIERQAAIDAIDEISREVDDGDGFDYAKWREYFCELPPVLGTNLAEVCMVCISRQAAIDRATKEHDFFRGAVTVSDKARRDELLNVMCWLGELPPAQPEQPEPKRGEWLERDVIDEPKGKHITQWQSARCSVCGRYHTTPYLYSFTHYNFCPNCGADMREVTT